MGGASIDVAARLGWLMLMSRLHHDDGRLSYGAAFNAALRASGLFADRSAISRWESGMVAPKWEVLRAYEQTLDLPDGQLTSVANSLWRPYAGDYATGCQPALDARSPAFHARLDTLFDSLLGGSPTGADWAAFGHHVAAVDGLYAQPVIWHQLSVTLIGEMCRSVGIAYLQRSEALQTLLGHRGAHPWLLHATADYLSDPAVQVVNDPMGVFEMSDAPEASDALLDTFLTTKSERIAEACVWAIAHKVELGHFTSAQLARIEVALVEEVERPAFGFDARGELLLAMPASTRARVLNASRNATEHAQLRAAAADGEAVRPEVAKGFAQHLADQVRRSLRGGHLYGDDPVAPRLIREALFSMSSARRHDASLMLLASPLGVHLAGVLTAKVDELGLDNPRTHSMTRLLHYLAGPAQEPDLIRWLRIAPDPVARDAALTLGHLPASEGDFASVVDDRLGDGGSVLDSALLYGAGMRQLPSLRRLVADSSRPERLRLAADWWVRQGGAVLV